MGVFTSHPAAEGAVTYAATRLTPEDALLELLDFAEEHGLSDLAYAQLVETVERATGRRLTEIEWTAAA